MSERDIEERRVRLEKGLKEKRERLKRLQDEIKRDEEELRMLSLDDGKRGGPRRSYGRSYDSATDTITVEIPLPRGRNQGRRDKFDNADRGQNKGGKDQQSRDDAKQPRRGRGQKSAPAPAPAPAPAADTSNPDEDLFERLEKEVSMSMNKDEKPVADDKAPKKDSEEQKKPRRNRNKRRQEQKKDGGAGAVDSAVDEKAVMLDDDIDWAEEGDIQDIPPVELKITTDAGEKVLFVAPNEDAHKKAEEFCKQYNIPDEYLDDIVAGVIRARQERQ